MSTALARRQAAPPAAINDLSADSVQLVEAAKAAGYWKGDINGGVMAILHGREVGLSPLDSLRSIASINGRPTIWGDALLRLVMGSGLVEDLAETTEGQGEARAHTVTIRRKGIASPCVATFSMADAKRAGLTGKAGPWTQYPDDMLRARAMTRALRRLFPDVLGGLTSREEAEDMIRAAMPAAESRPRLPMALEPAADEPAPEPEAAAEPLALTAERIADLAEEALFAARHGTTAYRAFWMRITPAEQKALLDGHEQRKAIAEQADAADAAQEEADDER